MLVTFIYAAAFSIVIIAAMVWLLWRHKKAATGDINLIGALASVEATLAPEGAVLVRGELWRARLKPLQCAAVHHADRNMIVKRGSNVRVVGASDWLLEVELAD